jgi:hypothetical protein
MAQFHHHYSTDIQVLTLQIELARQHTEQLRLQLEMRRLDSPATALKNKTKSGNITRRKCANMTQRKYGPMSEKFFHSSIHENKVEDPISQTTTTTGSDLSIDHGCVEKSVSVFTEDDVKRALEENLRDKVLRLLKTLAFDETTAVLPSFMHKLLPDIPDYQIDKALNGLVEINMAKQIGNMYYVRQNALFRQKPCGFEHKPQLHDEYLPGEFACQDVLELLVESTGRGTGMRLTDLCDGLPTMATHHINSIITQFSKRGTVVHYHNEDNISVYFIPEDQIQSITFALKGE